MTTESNKRKPRRLMSPRERLERRISNATRKLCRYRKRNKRYLVMRYENSLAKLEKELAQLAH